MPRIHRSNQHIGRHRKPQSPVVGHKTKSHRQHKRHRAKSQSPPAIAVHIGQIHPQRSQKHNIIESHLAKDFKRSISVEHVHPVRPHQHSCQNEPHNGRHLDSFHQHWGEKNQAQYNQHNPRGIRYQRFGKKKHSVWVDICHIRH